MEAINLCRLDKAILFMEVRINLTSFVFSVCSFFFSSRRRHTRFDCDWSSDVCSSDLRFKPEMCSLNMGSMNFAFHLMGAKVDKWRFPWEQQYIVDSEGAIFRNTFKDIADRKSTRLNSSHSQISYAVFCLKKKKRNQNL